MSGKDRVVLVSQENAARLFNLNESSLDLSCIDNRRFMYHPNGWLILGAEGTVRAGKLIGSHAEEFGVVAEHTDDSLPSYDEFIRGWIGFGGAYKYGIVHLRPPFLMGMSKSLIRHLRLLKQFCQMDLPIEPFCVGFLGSGSKPSGK